MKVTGLALLALLLALALAAPAMAANRGVVTRAGHVGQLRLDRSTEADVRALEGEPDRVFDFTDGGGGEARHLRYSCGRGCSTSYYIDVDGGGVLGDFQTTDRRFRSSRGTRIGMRVAEAERREGRRARDGCARAIFLSGRNHFLWIDLTRGRNGRVRGFIALSERHNVLDC